MLAEVVEQIRTVEVHQPAVGGSIDAVADVQAVVAVAVRRVRGSGSITCRSVMRNRGGLRSGIVCVAMQGNGRLMVQVARRCSSISFCHGGSFRADDVVFFVSGLV
ncbi:MAG: hypothetical protein D8H94_11085, partial [Cardiobacterium sp.]